MKNKSFKGYADFNEETAKRPENLQKSGDEGSLKTQSITTPPVGSQSAGRQSETTTPGKGNQVISIVVVRKR